MLNLSIYERKFFKTHPNVMKIHYENCSRFKLLYTVQSDEHKMNGTFNVISDINGDVNRVNALAKK